MCACVRVWVCGVRACECAEQSGVPLREKIVHKSVHLEVSGTSTQNVTISGTRAHRLLAEACAHMASTFVSVWRLQVCMCVLVRVQVYVLECGCMCLSVRPCVPACVGVKWAQNHRLLAHTLTSPPTVSQNVTYAMQSGGKVGACAPRATP